MNLQGFGKKRPQPNRGSNPDWWNREICESSVRLACDKTENGTYIDGYGVAYCQNV
jgi:predicted transcriptional regulator